MADSIEVQDGTRVVTFDGEMLGEVTSQRPSSPRWSEYRIYKTVGGTYVLEKVGRSIVVHMPDCENIINELPRFQEQHPGKDPSDGWWFCERCTVNGYDITQIVVEEDRNWVTISEDPSQIIDALHRRKAGARSLQRLSLELLDSVSQRDEAIRAAFSVEHLA